MAAIAAGEAEGGESEFLKQDSKENATSGGVNGDEVAKFIGSAVSLALAINDLVRNIKDNKIEDKEQLRYRYSVGILYPGENRDAIVKQGKVSPYYSSSSIRDLLRKEKLPYGWSETATVEQGFGKEVSLALYKNKNRRKLQRIITVLNNERNIKIEEQKNRDLINKLKLNKTIEKVQNIRTLQFFIFTF